MTVSSGWFDPWAGPDADYFAAMAAQNTAPQRLVIGPWSHVGMRGDATFCHEVDFGPDSVWGVERYFEEQLEYFSRWLPDDAAGQPAGRGADPDLRDGRRLGPQHGRGQARPRRPLARRARVAARPGGRDDALPARRRLALAPSRRPATEPPRRSPTTRPIPCRRSAASTAPSASCPPRGRGWSRRGRGSSHPVLRLRDVLTPGPADQREAEQFFGSEPPYPRLSRAARRARLPDGAARPSRSR